MTAAALAPFVNEAYRDFSQPAPREAMERGLAKARLELGREYPLRIGGRELTTGAKIRSLNPSKPAEVVGVHQSATPEMAAQAIETAAAAFGSWRYSAPEDRANLAIRCADILRDRKDEFNAWLILESGKSCNEAEADTCEAIDFCEYYARLMLSHASPEPLVQMPGEHGRLVYLPLGVGIIIPPWNFPLAILAGMTVAALVAGNTVIIKPSSDTPTIGQKFAEVLLAAGFPAETFTLLTGSGGAIGDLLVTDPRTRFVSFTGSKEVGLRINELAAKAQPGQKWIKRVVAEMGGKDAIVVNNDADLEAAATGIVQAAFGFQGQKCSACSRAIVHEAVYEEVIARVKAKTEALTIGPADDPRFHMGPVINDRARRTILDYMEIGKKEGRLVTGGGQADGDGYFLQPTIFADIESGSRLFQEEIFGPVLAFTKARDFDHALELANDSEYGLTGAAYTRDPAKIEKAKNQFFVGNLYINRKCTGAMVGAHPFGGFNMSGTDSKAGGPDYLLQFLQAKSIAEKVQ
jgi:1-pyrroline-5-carboxylate dehydrogenase